MPSSSPDRVLSPTVPPVETALAELNRHKVNRTKMMKPFFLSLLLAVTAAASDVKIQPCLPVHVWSPGRHVIGLLSAVPAASFSKVFSEVSSEPDHVGFWIEAEKVPQIRRLFPDVAASFSFGEPVAVAGATYVRVRIVSEARKPLVGNHR